MKNKKGVVYTTFAIIATSLLILLVSFTAMNTDYTSDTNPFRIGQASFYLGNVEEDFERAYEIAFQRGVSGATNYIIQTGNELETPGEDLRNSTVRGNISGYYLNNTENATLNDWTSRVKEAASGSQYELNIKYTDMDVEDEFMDLEADLDVFFQLKDPKSLAQFNRTDTYSTKASIEGLEDPLLLLRTGGRYISTIEKCSYDTPADLMLTSNGGNQQYNDGATYGLAEIVGPSQDLSDIDNRSRKILVTEDIENYAGTGSNQTDQVNQFAGVVSAEPIPASGSGIGEDPDDYNIKYVFDTGTIASLEQGMSITLNENQVWNTRFRDMMKDKCYLKSNGTQPGPGFLERTQNQLEPSTGENQGLETIVNEQNLPSDVQKGSQGSNVGYVLFQDASGFGGLNSINGVTDGRPETGFDYYSGFRLDRYHVEEWGIEELVS